MLHWESLDAARTERGIQMLLRRKFPGLRSLDGAGGDGGRDAQLMMTPEGRCVFEIKSFGRLTASRRRQIERSLRKAVETTPDMTRWVLVIPMNRTPARPGVRSSEETWFDHDLPQMAPGVDMDWWGQDWLDDQVAQNMDVQRYIEGADAQLLQRASEMHMETAVLAGGADDVHARLANFQRRVDEISPFWTLDISLSNGTQTNTLRAKVDDAHIIDPITITHTFSFRPDDPHDVELREQFERTLAFGGRVNLPAGYVTDLEIHASDEARLLFPADPAVDALCVVTEREHLERSLRCFFQVIDDRERVIEQFPVHMRERTAGSEGVTLYGGDAADIAVVEIALPRPVRDLQPGETVELGRAHLNVRLPHDLVGYDVDALLPVLRTLAAATESTCIRLQLPGFGCVTGDLLTGAAFVDLDPYAQVVDDLHRLSLANGALLRFPANMTVGQVKELRAAVRQLDGENVEHKGGLTLTLRPDAVGGFLRTLPQSPGSDIQCALWMATETQELQVGDATLTYGPTAFWAPAARLTNREQLETIAASSPSSELHGGVEARFEPNDVPFRWVSRDQALAYFESGEHPTETEGREPSAEQRSEV